MIVIADSGGTSTQWRIIDESGQVSQASTTGLNPYYMPLPEVKAQLTPLVPATLPASAQKVYFYGAGLDTAQKKAGLEALLQEVFTLAQVYVASDMLAAARGLCGHEPGIACILGTGANATYYNGQAIEQNKRSLGFILGDEGSGAWLGKALIRALLRNDLPANLATAFAKRFPEAHYAYLMEHTYIQPRANTFLASFSKFLWQYRAHPWVQQTVQRGFKAFFTDLAGPLLHQYGTLPVHFTGSVAFYFNQELRQVALEQGLSLGRITEGPIAGLTLFHGQDQ